MHIAICDDNIADRKHLERLLSRESDKRMGSSNVLYVDSYGDKEHFLFHPQMYDLIFMDMSAAPTLTAEIVESAVRMGVRAPIVLYSSRIDYTQLPNLPDNVLHRRKPYTPEQLPELLAMGDTQAQGHIETITVHQPDGKDCYPAVHNIMYYAPHKNAYTVFLSDGSNMAVADDACAFQRLCEPYREFCRITDTVIVNMRYVAMITPLTVMMQDYREFRVSPLRFLQFISLKKKINESDE